MRSFISYLIFDKLRFPERNKPRLLCVSSHGIVHDNVLIDLNRLPFLLAAAPDLCGRPYAPQAWQSLPDVLSVVEPVLLGGASCKSDQADADFLE